MTGIFDKYTPEGHLAVEGLNPATYEGFAVGDKVRFVTDLADDVKAGTTAVITALDDHEIYPATVSIEKTAKGKRVDDVPVSLAEIEVAK